MEQRGIWKPWNRRIGNPGIEENMEILEKKGIGNPGIEENMEILEKKGIGKPWNRREKGNPRI